MSSEEPRKNREIPSKSQRKREAQALFNLGRELVRLDRPTFERVPLPDEIREAVEEARAIKSHVAHKRQLQFLARRLRNIDAEPIREALHAEQSSARELTLRQHRIEAWRDRLIDEGDAALEILIPVYGPQEIQTLRQLVRAARSESERGKPPASARKLFRHLRLMDARQDLPA